MPEEVINSAVNESLQPSVLCLAGEIQLAHVLNAQKVSGRD
jgi:hypothetical protein